VFSEADQSAASAWSLRVLILTAHNITEGDRLERADGTSRYDVLVRLNERVIWHGPINNHVRSRGAAALIALIAEAMNDNCPASR